MREKTGGAHNTWVGTDIEVSYFPKDPPSDTTYHYQSMTQPWPKDWEGTLDLVHSRFALPGVGTTPLDEAVKYLISLVKPGGWIQLVELEWDDWKMGVEGRVFYDAMRDLMSMVSNGQGVDMREKLMPLFNDAGLENMDYKIIKIPFGACASEKIRATSEESLFATTMGLNMTTKKLPPITVSREKLDELPQRILEELKREGLEFKLFALWAQKPA